MVDELLVLTWCFKTVGEEGLICESVMAIFKKLERPKIDILCLQKKKKERKKEKEKRGGGVAKKKKKKWRLGHFFSFLFPFDF